MIQPATLSFLRQLKRNNNKAWFDEHKEKYLDAKADFEAFVQQLIEQFGKIEPAISTLQVKDCVFRIYKDVRFSKDKTPYKVNFAASFNSGGKKVHLPGYYFHMEPGGRTFCGGGIWLPDGAALKKIRQEIDYNLAEFEGILKNKTFKKYFGEISDDNALVRPPQGYDAENPAIEYLKMKSFVTGRNLDDAILSSPALLKEVLQSFNALKPLVDFLSRALHESQA